MKRRYLVIFALSAASLLTGFDWDWFGHHCYFSRGFQLMYCTQPPQPVGCYSIDPADSCGWWHGGDCQTWHEGWVYGTYTSCVPPSPPNDPWKNWVYPDAGPEDCKYTEAGCPDAGGSDGGGYYQNSTAAAANSAPRVQYSSANNSGYYYSTSPDAGPSIPHVSGLSISMSVDMIASNSGLGLSSSQKSKLDNVKLNLVSPAALDAINRQPQWAAFVWINGLAASGPSLATLHSQIDSALANSESASVNAFLHQLTDNASQFGASLTPAQLQYWNSSGLAVINSLPVAQPQQP